MSISGMLGAVVHFVATAAYIGAIASSVKFFTSGEFVK